jgi:hypothetical protein
MTSLSGHPGSASPSDPAAMLPARDVPCVACGYNLRGLPLEHDCPECGQPIAAWVRADRFTQMDAAWLVRLRRGAKLLQLGVIAALPLVVPGLIVAAAGLWPLTSAPPKPMGGETAGDRATRLAARWCFGLGAIVLVVLAAGVAWNLAGSVRVVFGDWWLFDAIGIAAGALIVLGLASAWRHLSQLARRLPDGDLARGFARLRRDWFIAAGIYIAIALITNLVNAFRASAWVYQFGEATPALLAGTPLVLTLLWLWWRTLRAATGLRRTLNALPGAALRT